ncbi:hypothetical protein [Devosia alba]|uniref:hypothetical protein n=1 Tax=Devosia alba TaxID=3152360 RepID=UPI0032675AA0
MAAGQQSGTGAMTNLDDDKVRKDDILSNRDKSQRRDGQSLDSTGVRIDEYKDVPTNQRPSADDAPETEEANPVPSEEQHDRPGFDLDGATGENTAGKGLGLGTDAKEDRKDWNLPKR